MASPNNPSTTVPTQPRFGPMNNGRINFACPVATGCIATRPGMDLYYNILSPPSRAVLLLGEALGLRFNLISLDVHRKDYVNEAFKKINPQHTVPTLVVDGVAICEPGAILGYLAERHGPAESALYPNEPLRRAIVNQRLLFECGTLYKCIITYYSPVVLERATPVDADRQKLEEAVAVLESILCDHSFVAGEQLTVADYSLVCTVSMLVLLKFDLAAYGAVRRWYERCKDAIAGYTEITQRAVTMFHRWMERENKAP